MEENQASVLKPGTSIKPLVTVDECKILAKNLYGFRCVSVTELNGYDDKNFRIQIDIKEAAENEHLRFACPHGYVLKVLNSLDSQKVDFVEAQNSLMLFLENYEITTPKPVRNKKGDYYSIEELKSGRHAVRLLEFIPGLILYQIPVCSNSLLFQVGQFAANFDLIVKKFHHSAYDTHSSLWMLDSVPKLSDFLFAVSNTERRKLAEEIVLQFSSRVLVFKDSLEKGIIHGDFNEQNFIVEQREEEWTLKGVLDFGDTHYSCYIFELAVAMAYTMIFTKSLEAGGYVLAGYSSIRKLSQQEESLLKICIAARMCQSLVLGAYTHLQDPSNTYVLITATVGWELLSKLWSISDEDILNTWKAANQ